MPGTNTLDDAVIVALGGNLPGAAPSVEAALEAAVIAMHDAGLTVTRRSNWWRSCAWPDPSAPPFLNGVALVATDLPPDALLRALLKIECTAGRRREARNAPRTLDLDLIAYGRVVRNSPDLVLPHSRAHERLFVMGPLAEIAADWVHPVLLRRADVLATEAEVGRDSHPT